MVARPVSGSATNDPCAPSRAIGKKGVRVRMFTMRLSYRSRLDLQCESFILAGRSSCGTRRVCGRGKNGDTRAVEAIPYYTGNLADVRGPSTRSATPHLRSG